MDGTIGPANQGRADVHFPSEADIGGIIDHARWYGASVGLSTLGAIRNTMQGTIDQVVALVPEGRAATRGIGSRGPGSGCGAMTFFEFVRSARLAELPAGWCERQVADR